MCLWGYGDFHGNDTVEGMLKMLRRLIGENIDPAWKPDADLWPVKMDPVQLDQVLANLCINARDAISGSWNWPPQPRCSACRAIPQTSSPATACWKKTSSSFKNLSPLPPSPARSGKSWTRKHGRQVFSIKGRSPQPKTVRAGSGPMRFFEPGRNAPVRAWNGRTARACCKRGCRLRPGFLP